MTLGKHLTDDQFELLIQEMEYHRIVNDQLTSIENLKQLEYENNKTI